MDGCLFGKSIVIVASVEDARCILESAVSLILAVLFSLPVLIYQPCVIIICHLRLLRLICDSIIPIRRYALFQPAVIFQVQRSAISEAKREDISKHGIEDHEVDLQQALRMSMQLAIDATSFLRSNEVFPNRYRAIIEALNSSGGEGSVNKKNSLANPISFSGPTGADIHRNALFRKLLMKSGVYESAKEIAKREEILLRIEQWKLYGIRPGYAFSSPEKKNIRSTRTS
ncbi:hypothetical protein Tco_0385276 [Tanacetum coccineum]